MLSLELVVVIGFVGLFLALGAFILLSSHRSREKKRQIVQQLGFQAVRKPDEALLERIKRLRAGQADRHLKLENVSVKSFPDGQIYLFDLIDTGGSESSTLASNAVAVVAYGLDLPVFFLFPRMPALGLLAGMGNRLLDRVYASFGQPVELDDAEFNRHYTLIGEDVERIRRAFSLDVVRLLCGKTYSSIQAGGDLLVVSTIGLVDPREMDAATINARINAAMELQRMFA